jgi:hypothetical protein
VELMFRMFHALDRHQAKRGIIVYADKLTSVARKVRFTLS